MMIDSYVYYGSFYSVGTSLSNDEIGLLHYFLATMNNNLYHIYTMNIYLCFSFLFI